MDIDGRRKLFAFIGETTRERYLSVIEGGHATWVVRDARQGRALAVVVQHWDRWEPAELLVDSDVEMAAIGEAIHFEYRAQEDPTVTLAELRPS